MSDKKVEEERFLVYVRETALPKFMEGNAVYGNILQRVFLRFPGERELQVEIAAAYERLLKQISAKKLIRLSEEYRINYDGWYVEDDAADWWIIKPRREDFSYLTQEQYNAVLMLGTFLEDGFDRQWCMEALDGAKGSLPFFFLRLNDWVGAIREGAFILSKKRLEHCDVEELFFALPILEKVIGSGRRSGEHVKWLWERAKERALDIFREMPDAQLVGRLPYYGSWVKNAIYRLLKRERVLSLVQMEKLLDAERTGYGKKLLLDGIFLHFGYEKERLERYLASRNTIVRYQALWFCYGHEQTVWAGLFKMLLDRSRRIRKSVGYLLQKHTDFRILDFYLKELRQRASEVVLLGIGEYGTKKEITLIEPFLTVEGNRMVKAALDAYGRLAGGDGEAVYWKFLLDARPAVAKSAYRLIRKNRIHYGAKKLYHLFCERHGSVIGKYLLWLLLCEPSWERLPYLLLLYVGGELSQEEEWRVLRGIDNRYIYAVVSKEQAEKIKEILKRDGDKFPEKLKKDILFDLRYVTRE
ncbi:MAG: hypothetical protein K2N63_10480 [Lachnospiraceae bacterium]|nr:hypothetical protein [Lachnospiraceae bacterium]